MAPKLSKTIEPTPMGTPMAPQPPMGKASEVPNGLLPSNGSLVSSPGGRTLSMGVADWVGAPKSN